MSDLELATAPGTRLGCLTPGERSPTSTGSVFAPESEAGTFMSDLTEDTWNDIQESEDGDRPLNLAFPAPADDAQPSDVESYRQDEEGVVEEVVELRRQVKLMRELNFLETKHNRQLQGELARKKVELSMLQDANKSLARQLQRAECAKTDLREENMRLGAESVRLQDESVQLEAMWAARTGALQDMLDDELRKHRDARNRAAKTLAERTRERDEALLWSVEQHKVMKPLLALQARAPPPTQGIRLSLLIEQYRVYFEVFIVIIQLYTMCVRMVGD